MSNKLLPLTGMKTEDDLFDFITSSFKTNITTWEYFVNWQKVFTNTESIEIELNLLNYLVGKKNIKAETIKLISKYPEVIKAFPILIAIRDKSINILTNTTDFLYKNYNFKKRDLTEIEINNLAEFFLMSGVGKLLSEKKIKSMTDYAMGVEVGLDSNGRKNRGGSLMEKLVEVYIKSACKSSNVEYLSQANAKKIKQIWGIEIQTNKSSRIIDFVVKKNDKLSFVEVNFYGKSGSKLKSTATEYIQMHQYWENQGIDFIWITDGGGWQSTLRPLREYFDKANYLLNLEMLKSGILSKILDQ